MALSSAWFRGNSRLQQCLISDPAHVKLGDRGPHVALIQQALSILDDLPIDQQELASGVYGRSTAGAVKTYKTKRQIVNRSYQTSPDDIVGKMTIRQLDDDMGQQEKKRSRLLLAVGISGAPSPKGVVLTEATNPWRKWTDQFASADSAGRGVVVMPDGASPKSAAATITRAIGTTQRGCFCLRARLAARAVSSSTSLNSGRRRSLHTPRESPDRSKRAARHASFWKATLRVRTRTSRGARSCFL
jgi:hypothetical protein